MIKFRKIMKGAFYCSVAVTLILQNSRCAKEYSYEGGDSTLIANDTLLSSPIQQDTANGPLACTSCNPEDLLKTGNWNFKTGDSYLCGVTTNSGFFGGNSMKNITFFGPSACSVDTGIVVSAYFSIPFNQDRNNVVSSNAAFYYYDHNATKDILISKQEKPFSVTIQRFVYSTRIATGTFSGTVFKANGDTALLKEGKFKIYVK